MTNTENARLSGKPSRWPWALLALLILLAIIIVAVRFVKNNPKVRDSVQQAENVNTDKPVSQNQVSDNDQRQTITSTSSILTSTNDTSLLDRRVDFNNITLKSVGTNDMVFWINDSGATSPNQSQGRDILVHMSPTVQSQVRATLGNSSLKDGTQLAITGTIKEMPSLGDLQSLWLLNSQDANYAKNKMIYIEADTVQLKQ